MKKQKNIRFTTPIDISFTDRNAVQKYLEGIGWETDKDFTAMELRKILIENLQKYLKGNVSLGFVLWLASAIYQEASMMDDTQLLSSSCVLDDFLSMGVKDPKQRKTYTLEEIEKIFRHHLTVLSK
jgi:hypothetical protein